MAPGLKEEVESMRSHCRGCLLRHTKRTQENADWMTLLLRSLEQAPAFVKVYPVAGELAQARTPVFITMRTPRASW